MIKAQRSLIRTLGLTALSLAMLLNTGCKSAQDKANDAAIAQAKQTAIATGVPQQVLWTGKDGKTTVVLVQPPAQGQSAPQLTTNTTTAANTVPGAPGPGQLPMIRPVPPVMTAVAPADPTSAADAPAVPSAAGGSIAGEVGNTAPAPPVLAPNVHVPAGTMLAIRVDHAISVKHNEAGDRFGGEIARLVAVNGAEVIPRGARVEGVVVRSHKRGHFKGRSVLELRLVSLRLNGITYRLDTRDNVQTKKGKGKRSSAFITGGTVAGMVIGGVATGGVGLVVGGLIGGGAGTGLAGLTGNRDIKIPAEGIVDFRLADDLVVQPS